MTDPAPRTGRRGRGRRPAAEVRADVLAAAGELLLAEGMAGFTFDRVSAMSGASKVTLYRWWPSKGALALESYFHAVEQHLEFPDTGDIEADLRTQVRAFVALLAGPVGPVVGELIGHWRSRRFVPLRSVGRSGGRWIRRLWSISCGGLGITGC